MSYWNQAPLVRLLFPLVIGIISAIFFPVITPFILVLIVVLFIVLAVVMMLTKVSTSFRHKTTLGICMNVTLLLLGYQLTILKTDSHSSNHYGKYSGVEQLAYVRIKEAPIEKPKSLKILAEVLSVKQSGAWKNTCGKAIIYFPKSNKTLTLNYGDELLINVNFKEISAPKNPEEFDYKRYLSFQNIHYQAVINDSNWFASGNHSANLFKEKAIALRDELLSIFTVNGIKNDEFAVGAALLLGYEDKLSEDIITSYSNTGVIHILSVSGLHVAMVYWVFSSLLFFLDKLKHGGVLKAVLLILFLWFYAMITGLSPSVMRAATMFSFIVIGKAYNRNVNIYNILAASAFLLLLINPYLIMNVGFQLSYLAVIGIVYIHPKIYQWITPSNWLFNQIWTITSVSLAAQIATLPLILYYFHQFPNYFLLSNLIVIPLSTLVIYIGIGLLVFSKITLLTNYLAIAFIGCIQLLNNAIFKLDELPYAVMKGISITTLEMILAYFFIGLLFYYFAKPKVKVLMYALGTLVFILCLQVMEQYQQLNQRKLIVYHVPKTTAIDFVDSQTNLLFTTDTLLKNTKALSFHIHNNWWSMGIAKPTIIAGNANNHHLMISDNCIQFYDKRVVVLNDSLNKGNKPNVPLKVDYMIVSKNKKLSIEAMIKCYRPELIIFDCSNSSYKVEQWKKRCDELQQPYYSVMESGALVVNL